MVIIHLFGGGTILLYNIKIGCNCVIGAGSVVTKSIPDNSVAVGNPARVIGTIENIENKYEKYSEVAKKIGLDDEEELEKFFWNNGKV